MRDYEKGYREGYAGDGKEPPAQVRSDWEDFQRDEYNLGWWHGRWHKQRGYPAMAARDRVPNGLPMGVEP